MSLKVIESFWNTKEQHVSAITTIVIHQKFCLKGYSDYWVNFINTFISCDLKKMFKPILRKVSCLIHLPDF